MNSNYCLSSFVIVISPGLYPLSIILPIYDVKCVIEAGWLWETEEQLIPDEKLWFSIAVIIGWVGESSSMAVAASNIYIGEVDVFPVVRAPAKLPNKNCF